MPDIFFKVDKVNGLRVFKTDVPHPDHLVKSDVKDEVELVFRILLLNDQRAVCDDELLEPTAFRPAIAPLELIKVLNKRVADGDGFQLWVGGEEGADLLQGDPGRRVDLDGFDRGAVEGEELHVALGGQDNLLDSRSEGRIHDVVQAEDFESEVLQ